MVAKYPKPLCTQGTGPDGRSEIYLLRKGLVRIVHCRSPITFSDSVGGSHVGITRRRRGLYRWNWSI